MARMGRFCKAYPVSMLEGYPRWRELARLDAIVEPSEGGEPYVFIQEDLSVTADVFLDEGIVFDALSPEWERFCRTELQFEVPEDCLDTLEPDEEDSVAPAVSTPQP